MSAIGSPGTATTSAILPGATVPRSLLVLEELGGVDGRRLQGEHRRHAGLHHQFELMGILAMRVDGGIGAEGDLDVRLVGAAAVARMSGPIAAAFAATCGG